MVDIARLASQSARLARRLCLTVAQPQFQIQQSDPSRMSQRADSDRWANGRNGRIARLPGSPREGPESAQKPSFHCEREIDFTARSGSASGDALNQRALGGKLPLSFSLHGRHQCLPTSDARSARKGARFRPRPTTSSSIAASPRRSLRSRAAPRPRSTKRKRPALAERCTPERGSRS